MEKGRAFNSVSERVSGATPGFAEKTDECVRLAVLTRMQISRNFQLVIKLIYSFPFNQIKLARRRRHRNVA